jgi:hypothetical protein
MFGYSERTKHSERKDFTQMSDHSQPQEGKLYTRGDAVKFLRERGFPISVSTMNRLSMPSCGQGPRVDRWFGVRPLYRSDDLLAWAQTRCRPGTPDEAA